MMIAFRPLEFVVTPETTYVLVGIYDHYRRIYTDGRDWPDEIEPTFAGYSIGKWLDTDGDGRYDTLEVETRGSFGGLGIEITIKNDVLTVVSPIEGTPAYEAGVKAEDEIIKINDDFTKGMTLTDAVKMMRGPKGSKIRLTLHRQGIPDLFTVSVVRDVIKIKSVRTKDLKEGYGYLRISTFQDGTNEDVEKAMDKFRKENQGAIKGVVLDLRDNPG